MRKRRIRLTSGYKEARPRGEKNRLRVKKLSYKRLQEEENRSNRIRCQYKNTETI